MRSSAVALGLLLLAATSTYAPSTYADEPRLPNPVVAQDAPDPGVLRVGDTYYMAATSGWAADAFPIRTSKDLTHWTDAGAVFPQASRPAWAKTDFWAPEIHEVGESYVCYYTARDASGRLCVGAATATTPLGPYKDLGQPLVRDEHVGSIDATFFEDANGARYLYWKSDGNDVGEPCRIYVRQLAADGLSFTGERVSLLTNDRPWEGRVVEGPAVMKKDGFYYLFYSGNSYADGSYATGVARSASPTGPFEKLPQPILRTGGAFAGPGHNALVTDPQGHDYIVFHAYAANAVGGPRQTLADRIRWENGWPAVNDGTPAATFEAPSPVPPPPAPAPPQAPAPPRPPGFFERARRWFEELAPKLAPPSRTPGLAGALRTGSRSAGSSTSAR